MPDLLLVRHAEAEGNRERRFIGQADVGLSDLGRHQAEALVRRLAPLPVRRVVSSDLRRARDTVGPLAEVLGLPLETDPRLREIANGDWGMLLPDEIETGWPDLWVRYQEGEDVLRPGGESWADVRARAVGAIEELEDGEEGMVVVGSHAGPILCLLNWAAGLTPDGNIFHGAFHRLDNASISVIVLPGPRLLAVNDTGHLPLPL